MSPVFAHGQLRLYLLALLNEGPRHGYEVIQDLEQRFNGLYSPSAGTVYPRLAKLEEEGLVERAEEGRKAIYRITDAGRAGGARPARTTCPASSPTSTCRCASWPSRCAPASAGRPATCVPSCAPPPRRPGARATPVGGRTWNGWKGSDPRRSATSSRPCRAAVRGPERLEAARADQRAEPRDHRHPHRGDGPDPRRVHPPLSRARCASASGADDEGAGGLVVQAATVLVPEHRRQEQAQQRRCAPGPGTAGPAVRRASSTRRPTTRWPSVEPSGADQQQVLERRTAPSRTAVSLPEATPGERQRHGEQRGRDQLAGGPVDDDADQAAPEPGHRAAARCAAYPVAHRGMPRARPSANPGPRATSRCPCGRPRAPASHGVTLAKHSGHGREIPTR